MTTEPQVDMSDAEIDLIAEFIDVPAKKVRGIVWLVELRARDASRHRQMWPLGPIGKWALDPCLTCGPVCDSTACPKRTDVALTNIDLEPIAGKGENFV